MHWILTTAIVCCYGFFKEFRPAEPFLTPYLVSAKNFTDDQVYSEIYPVWTYSYLAALVPVFLVTDLLRYNPVLLWESVAYTATWSLLLWGQLTFVRGPLEIIDSIVRDDRRESFAKSLAPTS